MGNYITRDQLRSHIGYRPEFNEDDAELDNAITAAEALVENWCGRVFTQEQAATNRIYRADWEINVDDVSDTSGATVSTSSDRTTWTTYSGDYHWSNDGPVMGAADGTGWPGTRLTFTGTTSPDVWVRVNAQHGWAAVPAAVTHATKLVAAQLLTRRHSPSGIEGTGEFGAIRVSRYLDPHAELELRPYRRAKAFAGIA